MVISMSLIVKIFEVFCVITVDILPPILDTGVQIWNGVELRNHNMTKNVEWSRNGLDWIRKT